MQAVLINKRAVFSNKAKKHGCYFSLLSIGKHQETQYAIAWLKSRIALAVLQMPVVNAFSEMRSGVCLNHTYVNNVTMSKL